MKSPGEQNGYPLMRNSSRFRSLRSALGLSATAVAVVGSMAFSSVAGATTSTANPVSPANNIIVGAGSATTYNMMQSLDTLYNSAPGCTLVVDNTSASAVQPLDYSCLTSATATAGKNIGALIINSDGTVARNDYNLSVVNPYNDVAVQEPPIGSSNGILTLEGATGSPTAIQAKYANIGVFNTANNTGFARSSRGVKSSDDKGLNFVAYATDGVTWTHYSKLGGAVTNSTIGGAAGAAGSMLSKQEIQDIFEGNITNWNQVGGGNAPIIVFSAQAGSGTQDTFKGWLGFDPSSTGNVVNCYNKTGLAFVADNTVAQSGVTQASQCTGPINIFENETGSLSLTSIPTALKDPTSFLSTSTTNNVTTEISTGATAAAAKAAAAPADCAKWVWGCTAATAAVANSGGSGATAFKLVYTFVRPTDTMIKSDSIFFYSSGKFNAQCVASGSSFNNATSCAAGNFISGGLGGIDYQLGQIGGAQTASSTAFSVKAPSTCSGAAPGYSPCLPTEASVLKQTFPAWRYLYNVYANGTQNAAFPAVTPATYNYVGETGFICQPKASVDPATGVTYVKEIQAIIKANGFYPISSGAGTGTITQTGADEGHLTHYGYASDAVAASHYVTYVTPSVNAGTKTAGGDPVGFCKLFSTDGDAAVGSPVTGTTPVAPTP